MGKLILELVFSRKNANEALGRKEQGQRSKAYNGINYSRYGRLIDITDMESLWKEQFKIKLALEGD